MTNDTNPNYAAAAIFAAVALMIGGHYGAGGAAIVSTAATMVPHFIGYAKQGKARKVKAIGGKRPPRATARPRAEGGF